MTVIVVHSTESDAGSANSAANWMIKQRTISNEVFDPSNGEHIDLVPWPHSARSLLNLPGGVETNRRGGVYQIEVVGRASSIPGYSEWWHKALAAHLVKTAERIGCPLVFPCEFLVYPDSYGRSRVRLSNAAWLKVEGIVGHQHVPENSHGDPGDISRTIDHITSLTQEDDDMALPKYAQQALAIGRLEQVCMKHRGRQMDLADIRAHEVAIDNCIATGRPIDQHIDWWDAALYAEQNR